MLNKRIVLLTKIIVLILFSLGISLGIVFLLNEEIIPRSKVFLANIISSPDSTMVKSDLKKDALEKILTKWVYEHSANISSRTVREIVLEIIKTDKPLLMLSLIAVESDFYPTARSNKGAVGLSQIMYKIHGKNLIKLGIIKEERDLFDIAPSVASGNVILETFLKETDYNVPKALERYLGGQDGVYLKMILLNLADLYIRVAKIKV